MNSASTIPWVEKYRPTQINQIIQQDIIKQEFSKIVETCNMPHMLLHGPPGTGKTSSILALVMALFGPYRVKERTLELNASDERGIGVVRNKIIQFAKLQIGTPDPNYPSPDFKIIILDEADAMTNDAQSALRKVMESTTRVTRFVFICNYDHQIIDAIKSRCSSFRFKHISNENCIVKLKTVSQKEGLSVTDDALMAISDISQGDVRRAINILQNIQYMPDQIIDKECIYKMTSYVDESHIINLWNTALTSSTANIYKQVNLLINEGYPIYYIMLAICKKVDNSTELSDINKAKINIMLAHCERRVIVGSNELIQLSALFCYINGLHKHNMDIHIQTF